MRKSIMKKIIIAILSIFLFTTVANASEKKFNDPSTPMQKLAIIEFAILPPIPGMGLAGAIAGEINAALTFKFYKGNATQYNELLGEKIDSSEPPFSLIFGNALYNSSEYLDLKGQEVNFYNTNSVEAYIPEGSYNFIDFDKYGGTQKIIQSQYEDEKDSISQICRSLNIDGAIICYFYMNGDDVMFLEANFFDDAGTYIKKISITQGNMFLTKNNFENTFTKAVNKLVIAINRR